MVYILLFICFIIRVLIVIVWSKAGFAFLNSLLCVMTTFQVKDEVSHVSLFFFAVSRNAFCVNIVNIVHLKKTILLWVSLPPWANETRYQRLIVRLKYCCSQLVPSEKYPWMTINNSWYKLTTWENNLSYWLPFLLNFSQICPFLCFENRSKYF